MQPITIYDVRENYCYTDEQEQSLVVESVSQRSFQTIASAQIYLQELLNARVQARIASMERYPDAYNNTAEALAALSANKLHFDAAHYRVNNLEAITDLPIFFIKEQKVLY